MSGGSGGNAERDGRGAARPDGGTGLPVGADGLQAVAGDAALKGVDLAAPAGEITVVAGVETAEVDLLLSCLAGVERPGAGTVAVGGDSPDAARGRTSFDPPTGAPVPALTGRECLEFYADVHPAGTDRWAAVADRLGLTDVLDRRVAAYPAPARRKLSVAAALSADVPVYLLVEPTAGLDAADTTAVHEALRAERDAGRTVVVGTTRPGDVRVGDRVAFLRDGRVLRAGPLADLREALPVVVRVSGGEGSLDPLGSLVAGGQVFEDGDGWRAYLRPGVHMERVRGAFASAVDPPRVERVDPRPGDVHDYYLLVEPLLS